MRLIPTLVTSKPIEGEMPRVPASPLAWNAAYRSVFAVMAISGLWSAVGWALGWWEKVQ